MPISRDVKGAAAVAGIVYTFEPGKFFLIGGANAGIAHAMLGAATYFLFMEYVVGGANM